MGEKLSTMKNGTWTGTIDDVLDHIATVWNDILSELDKSLWG